MVLYIKYRAKKWPRAGQRAHKRHHDTVYGWPTPKKNRMGQPGPPFNEMLQKHRHDGVSRLAHHHIGWPHPLVGWAIIFLGDIP